MEQGRTIPEFGVVLPFFMLVNVGMKTGRRPLAHLGQNILVDPEEVIRIVFGFYSC